MQISIRDFEVFTTRGVKPSGLIEIEGGVEKGRW